MMFMLKERIGNVDVSEIKKCKWRLIIEEHLWYNDDIPLSLIWGIGLLIKENMIWDKFYLASKKL